MRQTPDLSAILKGQMRSLSKKKTATVVDDEPAAMVNDDPSPVATPVVGKGGPPTADRDGGKEGSDGPSEVGPDPDQAEEELPRAPTEMAQQKPSKKKKKEKKRSREESSKRETEGSNASHEDAVELSVKASPGAQSKKQKKVHSSRQGDPPVVDTTPDDPFPGGEREGDFTPAADPSVVNQKKASKKKVGVSRSAPSSSVGASGSFTTRGPRVDFPDRVIFSYDGDTPLIYNPVQCAELTRQVRGGPIDLPPIADLSFKDEYIEAAHARKRVTLPLG